MKKLMIICCIFFLVIQGIAYFSLKLLFWELFLAIYVLYFLIVHEWLRTIGIRQIRNFFDRQPDRRHRQYNPFGPRTLAAILFFGFFLVPFLFVLSFATTKILYTYIPKLNAYLQDPYLNLTLQCWTTGGIFYNLWRLSKAITNE